MPNRTSTPSSSSARTTASAPVIFSLAILVSILEGLAGSLDGVRPLPRPRGATGALAAAPPAYRDLHRRRRSGDRALRRARHQRRVLREHAPRVLGRRCAPALEPLVQLRC